jgi:hypothetical protein
MWRVPCVLLLLLGTGICVRAAEDLRLLQEVANQWWDERDNWAFTQVVREFDGEKLAQERLERYDPSQGDEKRWRLLAIDGRPPTADERAEWSKRKNKKHRKERPPITAYLDFEHARVAEDTPKVVRYEVPLRSSIEWLFPVNKVELLVTIEKQGPALTQVQARISEPFRVALGLARVLDVDLDVQMEPPPSVDPADAKPTGEARATVTKLGRRVEYYWTDFTRADATADDPSRRSAANPLR